MDYTSIHIKKEEKKACFTLNKQFYYSFFILTILLGIGSYLTYYFTENNEMIGILIILVVTYASLLMYCTAEKKKDCQIITLHLSFLCLMLGYSIGVSYIISDN